MTFIKTGNQQDEMQFFPQEYEILTLFPLRNSEINRMNQEALSKLLSCRLCSSLLQDAVYLKCSHRFCKKCIQKHIRSSAKKGCPVCKMPVLTKRQLKIDPFFGQFASIIPICQKKSCNNFKFQDDYPSLLKQEQNSIKNSLIKKRKRPQSLNISEIQNSFLSKKVKTSTPYQSIQRQNLQQSFSFFENTSSQIQVQQKLENIQADVVKFESYNNKQQENQQIKSKKAQKQYFIRQNCEKIPFSDPNIDVKLGNSSQFIDLISQTNQNYPNENQSSIQTNKKYPLESSYTNICLRNHPLHYFTPMLPFSEISCATNTCLANIASLIGNFFNVSRHHVRLFSIKQGLRNSLPFYLTVKKLFGCFQSIEYENHSLEQRIDFALLIDQLGMMQIKQQYICHQKKKDDQIIYFTIQTTKINPKQRHKR